MNMQYSNNGLALTKGFEGLRLIAYKDSAGVWTIGYGSTRYKNGAPVKRGDTLVNEECANDLLLVTMQQYVDAVNNDVKVPLTQNQFDALVDFTYNEGTGALAMSTLLKKLNAKDYAGAADQFLNWDEITNPNTHQKEVLNDLYVRRTKERALFLHP